MADDQYNYDPISPNVSDAWRDAEKGFNQTAYQGAKHYAEKLNAGVGDQSNLMGPSDDPERLALQERANNLYKSNLNQVFRAAVPRAEAAVSQMSTQDIAQRSAIYSNEQSRAALNYKQAAFQRAAAIYKENIKRSLYKSIFGGVAQLGGSALAAAAGGDDGSGGIGLGGIGAGIVGVFGGGGKGKAPPLNDVTGTSGDGEPGSSSDWGGGVDMAGGGYGGYGGSWGAA